MPRRSGRHRLPLVTLSSDVGSAYAAQMKAVLAHSLDPGRVVDLSHDLPAHAVEEAAFVVRAMAAGFPPGTIHVVVVDPGVGGRRVPVVVECRDGSRLVGPDNGVLYPLAQLLGVGPAYRIEAGRLRARRRVGTTFDGRDVFAPAAVRLAEGQRPADLGPPSDLRILSLPEARKRDGGAEGNVVHVDHFGNLITNVPTDWVPARTSYVGVRVGSRRNHRLPWATSYESVGGGRAGALGSSFGTVEVAVSRGRAVARFRARVGTALRFQWVPSRPHRVRA
jgi:S-adenosyl-L-methionine hydrolase (adenosine-forming)